ncbi:MAG: glycosyltransferase family 39 protein, partial [Candidatus Altiarchaeota archaeon]|nr:glycosyltransferase family 39 protein [Candidatus Altiarchaeota archaeon]
MKPNSRLIAILLVAVLLRAVNLPTIPAWGWDEGGNLNYSSNLMEGKAQFFAYKYHFMPHPPLYFVLSALVLKLLGVSITSIRILSVLLSVAGLLVVYKIVKTAISEEAGLLAGALYAIFPELIYWGRVGYGNNLLGFMALLSVYFLYKFLKDGSGRDFLISAAITSLCPLVELHGVVFVLAFWIVV